MPATSPDLRYASDVFTLHNAAAATATGLTFKGPWPTLTVQITPSSFSGTLDLQTSLDGTNWDNCQYFQTAAAPTSSVSQISLTTNSTVVSYRVPNATGFFRVNMTRTAGSVTVKVRGFADVNQSFPGAAITLGSIANGGGSATFNSSGKLTITPTSGQATTIANDGLTITAGGLTITAGSLTMAAANSKLVPGATNFSLRNNADNADNVLVSDAGAVTVRAGLTVTTGGVTLDTGTASATTGAATLNKYSGTITSEALTTAAGSIYTLTLTNSTVAATSKVLASADNGTNTQGEVTVERITPAAGSVVILVKNSHASQALNGTIKVNFVVFP